MLQDEPLFRPDRTTVPTTKTVSRGSPARSLDLPAYGGAGPAATRQEAPPASQQKEKVLTAEDEALMDAILAGK